MEEFVACFAEIVDPRQDNARHDLHELLMIALCTLLSGGEDCSDMALFGEIKAPYPPCVRRVVACLGPRNEGARVTESGTIRSAPGDRQGVGGASPLR